MAVAGDIPQLMHNPKTNNQTMKSETNLVRCLLEIESILLSMALAQDFEQGYQKVLALDQLLWQELSPEILSNMIISHLSQQK